IVVIEAAYQGSQAEGDALIAPLRALGAEMDSFAIMPTAGLTRLHQDPEDPVPGAGDGAMLAAGPSEAIEAFIAAAAPDSGSTPLSPELRHSGGAVSRKVPGNGAARLEGEYVMFGVGIAATPEMHEKAEADVRQIQRALEPWSTHNYFNFSESAGE